MYDSALLNYILIPAKGWGGRRGKMGNRLYLPQTINKWLREGVITRTQLLQKGTNGHHFFDGFEKLCEMLPLIGIHHDPDENTLTDAPRPHPGRQRFTIHQLYDKYFEEDGTVCLDAKIPAADYTVKETAGVKSTDAHNQGNHRIQRERQDRDAKNPRRHSQRLSEQSRPADICSSRLALQ